MMEIDFDNQHFVLKIKNDYHAILRCESFEMVNNRIPSRTCEIVEVVKSNISFSYFAYTRNQIVVACASGFVLFLGTDHIFQYHEYMISPHEINDFIFEDIIVGDIVLLKTQKCNTSMNIVLNKMVLINQYGFNKIQFFTLKNLENGNIKYVYFNNKKILFIDDEPIVSHSVYRKNEYPDYCNNQFLIYLRINKIMNNISIKNGRNSDENLVELKLFEKHLQNKT